MGGTMVEIGRDDVVRDAEGWIRRRHWETSAVAVFAAANAIFYAAVLGWAFANVEADEDLLEIVLFASVGLGIPITVAAYFAVRLPRVGIRMSGDGIVVRGPVRTWHVDLRDTERFIHGQLRSAFAGELLRCTYGVQLERRKGAPVPVWALRSGQWNNEEGLGEGADAWRPVCRRLNEELLALKGGAI